MNAKAHKMLALAYQEAIHHSSDPSTMNGAVLVDSDGNFVLSESNHFARGVQETKERWERPLKYSFVEHAERGVIYKAAREGIKTEGLIMYCPWFACTDCARAIIQAGIIMVIGHKIPQHEGVAHWEETVKIADTMLREAGVMFTRFEGVVGKIIRFQGKLTEV